VRPAFLGGFSPLESEPGPVGALRVWKREQDDAWVPMNGPALRLFRFHVGWLWYRTLSRRRVHPSDLSASADNQSRVWLELFVIGVNSA
jgi:hypothetical protein